MFFQNPIFRMFCMKLLQCVILITGIYCLLTHLAQWRHYDVIVVQIHSQAFFRQTLQ